MLRSVFACTAFLVAGSLHAASFEWDEATSQLPIEWASMSRPAPLPPLSHAAMLVPVSFDGLSGKRLLMQLDLGHPETVLYSNKWKDIAERLNRRADEEQIPRLLLRLGSSALMAKEVGVRARSGPGVDWDRDSPEVVGTLGTDFIQDRVVTIDFRNGSVSLSTSRPALPHLHFQAFRFEGRRLLLPAVFEGRAIQLMYDSGSSAFTWLTSQSEFERLAQPRANAERYPIRSWNSTVTAVTAPTQAEVQIGAQSLPIGQVSHIEGMGLLQRMAIQQLGAGGMVGNKLFLGRTLVIDMARKEFALH